MIFILGDDIRSSDGTGEFTLQPRAMILGQITKPYFVKPTGHVSSFAVSFYPYSFVCLSDVSLNTLVDKELPLSDVFGRETSQELQRTIAESDSIEKRIGCIEGFLRSRMEDRNVIDSVVKSTVDSLFRSGGGNPIASILGETGITRRSLERKSRRIVGVSPKRLAKIIRFQASLRLLLDRNSDGLSSIAYESNYFDQAHFAKDFKDFTGVSPSKALDNKNLLLSSTMYEND